MERRGDLLVSQIENCPTCGQIYMKNAFRDVCEGCYRKEEEEFQLVYKFIRQRKNRTATMEQVEEGTGVPEKLIMKFIRKGRIQLAQFPHLGYPCDRCGTLIREERLCGVCKKDISDQISQMQREEERQQEMKNVEKTYHSVNKKYR